MTPLGGCEEASLPARRSVDGAWIERLDEDERVREIRCPAGRSRAALPRGWTSGTANLAHPLVLVELLDPGAIYGPSGWKARLFAATKRRQSDPIRYLMAHGFDSVVPVRGDGTTEIVVLRA